MDSCACRPSRCRLRRAQRYQHANGLYLRLLHFPGDRPRDPWFRIGVISPRILPGFLLRSSSAILPPPRTFARQMPPQTDSAGHSARRPVFESFKSQAGEPPARVAADVHGVVTDQPQPAVRQSVCARTASTSNGSRPTAVRRSTSARSRSPIRAFRSIRRSRCSRARVTFHRSPKTCPVVDVHI